MKKYRKGDKTSSGIVSVTLKRFFFTEFVRKHLGKDVGVISYWLSIKRRSQSIIIGDYKGGRGSRLSKIVIT